MYLSSIKNNVTSQVLEILLTLPTPNTIMEESTISDLKRFPCYIRQETPIWCIPATVEAVMKYLDPSLVLEQKSLVEEYIKSRDFGTICYANFKDAVLEPRFGTEFCFTIEIFPEFEDWKNAIKKFVLLNLPPLISVRVQAGAHMAAILGFTDSLFLSYDPAIGCKPVFIEKFRDKFLADVLIIKQRSQLIPSK